MARLPYLQQSDLAEADKDLLAGHVINLNRLMAHSPEAMRNFSKAAMFIRHKSRLDPRLREMAILQVGYATRSPYEYSHHVKIGLGFGVSEDDIRAIAEETAGRPTSLDPLARTVLRAAREMTENLAMSDATFAALEEALGRERLVDLMMAIALYNAVVRLLATFQIDIEPEYLGYLERFPLPPT